jgi:DEAD/DEAH box helicase domain-containing protein
MIFFDLETQYLAAEVGGWGNKELLRLAVAATFDDQQQYQVWWEAQASDLIETLRDHDMIVGFNTRAFDFAVLSFYGDTRGFAEKNFDILAEVRAQGAGTLSLNHLANINLDEGKSYESGAVAVELFRTGRLDELSAYCQKDVELTKRLFEKWEAEGILFTDTARTRFVVWPGYYHLLDAQKAKRKKRWKG